MDSPGDPKDISSSSDPSAPTLYPRSRPRSLTVIPYVGTKQKTNAPVPVSDLLVPLADLPSGKGLSDDLDPETSCPAIPLPKTPSVVPFPDFSPEMASHVELKNLKYSSNLAAPSTPSRTASPFPCYSFVTDTESLQIAVSQNPDRIFQAIKNLVNERDTLRADLARTSEELQSTADDLAYTRVDHKTARRRYEELFSVAANKQDVLWKYIESLSQLAAGIDLPQSNKATNGIGGFVCERGGSGMNNAMEKWISEGFDSGREESEIVSIKTTERSEKGAERSVCSADDSVTTKNLNPDAQAFVPASESPQKFRRGSQETRLFSPDRGRQRQTPSAPANYNSGGSLGNLFFSTDRGQERQPPSALANYNSGGSLGNLFFSTDRGQERQPPSAPANYNSSGSPGNRFFSTDRGQERQPPSAPANYSSGGSSGNRFYSTERGRTRQPPSAPASYNSSGSPGQRFFSPDRGQERQPPSAPANYDSGPVQDSFKGQTQGQPSLLPMKFQADLLQRIELPHDLIASLPSRWCGICPQSLVSSSPCPLGIKCHFVPLCTRYNDIDGYGCEPFRRGGRFACRFVHEYRFCHDALGNEPGGCKWERDSIVANLEEGVGRKSYRAYHMKFRAHKSRENSVDWEARMLLLSLQEAHSSGMFNGGDDGGGRLMWRR